MLNLTLPQPVLFVLWRLQQEGFEAYLVGGAVRDLILGRRVNDWDFTTNATPDDLQKVFEKSFYDNQFGTVGIALTQLIEMMEKRKWMVSETIKMDGDWQEQVIDITTYRSEYGYTDRRRPDRIDWGKSLTDDLARRDFTINAMAITIKETKGMFNGLLAFVMREDELEIEADLIDPYEGLKDLADKVIKAVGVAETRFNEDALRMMRCIRFGAQLGFKIETKTLEAMQTTAHLIKAISWERIRDELLKIIASAYPYEGLVLLDNAGLLKHILPELLAAKGIKQGGHHIYDVWKHSLESLKQCPSTDPIVRLAALLHDIGKPKTVRYEGVRGVTFYGHEVVGARMAKEIGRRLRLSNREIERLFLLVRWHMFQYNPEMTDAAIRRFIKNVGLENINDMMLLRVGDRKGGGSKATSWRLTELQKRIGEQLYEPLSVKDLKIDGNEVMRILNLKPSKRVGEILNQLFEEIMEDSSKNEPEYLEKRVKELGA